MIGVLEENLAVYRLRVGQAARLMVLDGQLQIRFAGLGHHFYLGYPEYIRQRFRKRPPKPGWRVSDT